MKFDLTQELFYTPSALGVEKALEYARLMRDMPDPPILHFFWDGPFINKIKASLESAWGFNPMSKIYFWTINEQTVKEYSQRIILNRLEYKIYEPSEKIKHTFPRIEESLNYSLKDSRKYLLSDLIRLLVLYEFGGIYLDCDTITLRNLSALTRSDFAYHWGDSGFNNRYKLKINNAIIGFKRESKNCKTLIDACLAKKSPLFGSTAFGSDIFVDKYKVIDVEIYPCPFFNPEFGLFQEPLNPMKKWEKSGLEFDGSFTWHWHNRWNEVPEVGCKFDLLTKKLGINI